MYLRAVHAEHSIPLPRQFIQENPLGILTTAIPSPAHHLLQSSHIPFVLDVSDPTIATELPTLRGHIARQNPQTQAHHRARHRHRQPLPLPHRDLHQPQTPARRPPSSSTADAHHSISPNFHYPATKPATAKVVRDPPGPTPRPDASTVCYLNPPSAGRNLRFPARADRRLVAEGRGADGSWATRSPGASWTRTRRERCVEARRRNVVGVEVRVTSLGGKLEVSRGVGVGSPDSLGSGVEGLAVLETWATWVRMAL